MFTGLGSRNGEIMPLAALCVPVEDRGFLLGDAVYETLRTYSGRLFALREHLDRLDASLRALRIGGAPDRNGLARQLEALTQAAYAMVRDDLDERGTELVVRVTVTRGPGPHGFSAKGAGPPQVYAMARPLRALAPSVGLRVVTASVRRLPVDVQDPAIKAGSALNLVLARMEADAAAADEALLTDADGCYLEASGANLFVVRGRTFWTPRAGDGILEGVTMRRVVAILERLGLEGERRPIPADVLRAADEVFLTQTTREVVPVVAVDGRTVGDGTSGATTRSAHAAFRKEVTTWLRS